MLPMPATTPEPRPERPILVVDDDAKIVRLVRTYLEREGYTVVAAADGPAALDAIETHRPALVVLDLMLPELDGRAVIRAVRRDDEAAATPIIVLSARGSTIDRIAGLEDGADDYLPKPFSPAELVLRVKSILRRAAPADLDRHDPTAAAARRPGPRPRPLRGHPRRRAGPPDPGRVPPARDDPRGRRPRPDARPAARCRLRRRRRRDPGPHHRRPRRPPPRQARRRPGPPALRRHRPRRRVSRGPDRARRLARGSRHRPPDRARGDRLRGGRGDHRGRRGRGGRCRDLHRPDGRGGRLGRARPRDVRPVGHDRRPRGRGRGGRRQPPARDRPVADAGPAAGRDRQRRPPDRRGRLRRAGPARRPRRAPQPGRLVQPDGRQPRAPGGDAARLHRQRGARAADAPDQPAGLPRGAARRRDHRGPGHVRIALGRGGAARPARRARSIRSPRATRPARRPWSSWTSRWRSAAPSSSRSPGSRRPASRSSSTCPSRCPRAPTRTSSPRCSRTCCPTPRGTRPPAARSRSRAERRPADLLVSIENSGEGIPPEDLDRVFERFYRVEKSRDRARGGAGIGLAIVKQLVELAGGRVGAESASGTTRFWFSLPA